MRKTGSGLLVFEDLNERRSRMEAWWARADKQGKRLEKALRQLDPRFRVVFIDPEAANNKPEARAPGVIPGRWHLKLITSKLNHYFPICGPNREYRDPEMAIVDEMKARDLWRRGALEQIREDEEKEAARLRRQELTESESRIEQVAASYRAAKRVPGDGGETRSFASKRKGEGLSSSRGGVLLPPGASEG